MMADIRIGIDLGNGYTKYCGKRFRTAIKVGTILNIGNKRDDIHTAIFQGQNFIVGEGNTLKGDEKYKTTEYKVCLLTAIADSDKRLKNVRAEVSVGLPLLNFDRLRDEVEREILSWGKQDITVDGRDVTIEIVKVSVFVEGALPILKNDTSKMLTIDVGSGTVNAVQWENMSPVNYTTINGSYNKIYSEVANQLNIKYGGGFSASIVEEFMLEKKTQILIKQEPKDVSLAYSILENFINGFASEIIDTFDTGVVDKICILGGGAESSYRYWLNHFPKAELVDDSQFINSQMFDMVAKSINE